MAELWDDIVKAALLGTDRQAPVIPAASGALGDALAALAGQGPEAALLGAACVVSIYQRAGRLPSRRGEKEPRVAPCEPDQLPRVGDVAAFHLMRILGGEHRTVLPEWLAAAAAAGRRVPEESLPGLLDLAKAQADLRPLLAPVLGRRGHWLAAQNPAWDFAAAETDDESLWDTGTRAARLSLLARLRPHRPARSVALLRSTWAEESADDRAAFLATLATGLGMADEPFLEEALDDRSKVVRKQAALLLAAIPESGLCRRMIQRVRPHITWVAGKKPKIEITLLSHAPDAAAERDGIDTSKPKQGLGQKAWWLFQMVAMTPPGAWSGEWGRPPAELIAIAKGGEWEAPLLEAWARAAARVKDPEWAEALWVENVPGSLQLGPENLAAVLLQAVPEARRDELLLRRFEKDKSPLADDSPVLNLLQQYRRPWSEALARSVLDTTKSSVLGSGGWRLRSLLPQFAMSIPPGLLTEAAAGWPADQERWGQWRTAVDEMLAVLQFRHDFLKGMSG